MRLSLPVDLPVHHDLDPEISGVLRIGPIPNYLVGDMAHAMRRHGLAITSNDDVQVFATPAHGPHRTEVFLVALGAGVTGYMVEEDGSEADPEEIGACLESVLPEGINLKIEGQHVHPGGAQVSTIVDITIKPGRADVSRAQRVDRPERDTGLDFDR